MSLSETIHRLKEGEISPYMALLYLILETEGLEGARTAIEEAIRAERGAGIEKVREIFLENQTGCARIVEMLQSGIDSDQPANSVEEGIAFSKRLFDWSVRQNEEASVALYSFCNPEILRQATDEIVEAMAAWGLLDVRKNALEIGCGFGRFQKALAPHFREIIGVDVSSQMIEAARIRCEGIANVRLEEVSGRDLARFPDGSIDLLFAVDSFPYLHQSGMPLVQRYFEEARRTLRPGGDFLILNFSYRNDPAADRGEVLALSERYGFRVLKSGERPFRIWDGAAFLLRLI